MRVYLTIVCCLFLISACQSVTSTEVALPEGSIAEGEKLFQQSINGAPSCASCHHVTDESFTGPGLAGFSQVAGGRVMGLSAADYAHQSIIQPARYIVSGYSNLMYSGYANRLTNQQLADLIAYLLTL